MYLSFIPNFKSVFNWNKIRGDQIKGKTVNFRSALSPFFDNFQIKGFPFEINLNGIKLKKSMQCTDHIWRQPFSQDYLLPLWLSGLEYNQGVHEKSLASSFPHKGGVRQGSRYWSEEGEGFEEMPRSASCLLKHSLCPEVLYLDSGSILYNV